MYRFFIHFYKWIHFRSFPFAYTGIVLGLFFSGSIYPAMAKTVGLYGMAGERFDRMKIVIESEGHTFLFVDDSYFWNHRLDEIDILFIDFTGGATAGINYGSIISEWVIQGGTLVTEMGSTWFTMIYCGFTEMQTRDKYYVMPSGSNCGRNTIMVVDPTNPLSKDLPASWACSGNTMAIFEMYYHLDTSFFEPVLQTNFDYDKDGNLDVVLTSSQIGDGHWYAFYSIFTLFGERIANPGECNTQCGRVAEDDILLKNIVGRANERIPTRPISLDILPGFCPNTFNGLDFQSIPVAIVGDASTDVGAIDVSTIRLGGVVPTDTVMQDVAAPYEPYLQKSVCSDCSDAGPDGIDDLILYFKPDELLNAIRTDYGSIQSELCYTLDVSGTLVDGSGEYDLEGKDFVRVGKDPETLHGRIRFVDAGSGNGNAVVRVELENTPSSIRRLRFYLETPFDYEAELISSSEGGLCENWSMQIVGDPNKAGKWIELQSPDPDQFATSIPTGANGPIVKLTYPQFVPEDPSDLAAFLGQSVEENRVPLTSQVEADNSIYHEWQSWACDPLPFTPLPLPVHDQFLPSYATTLRIAPISSGLSADYLTDGIDDQVEINQAIHTVHVLGGGNVELAEGTYRLSSSVQLFGNINFIGSSSGITTLQWIDQSNRSVNGMVRLATSEPVTQVVIQDIKIDGNRENQTSGKIDGFSTENENSLWGTERLLLRRVTVQNCSNYGVNLDRNGRFCVIQDCQAIDNGKDGFIVDQGEFIAFQNVRSTGNGRHGFNFIDGSHFCEMKNCLAQFNKSCGVMMQSQSYRITVDGGDLSNNQRYGGLVNGGSGNQLLNLLCDTNGGAGIGVSNWASNISIRHNHIQDCGYPGLNLSQVTDCEIVDNTIESSQGHGINIYRSSNNYIAHNSLINNSQSVHRRYSGINITNDGQSYSKNNAIVENYIYSNSNKRIHYGILIRDPHEEHNMILDNEIYGTVSDTVFDHGTDTYILGNTVWMDLSSALVPTPTPTTTPTVSPTPTTTPTVTPLIPSQ